MISLGSDANVLKVDQKAQQDLLISKLIQLLARGRAFLFTPYSYRHALYILARGYSVILDRGRRAF
jgi:hypothetical protein